MKNIEWYEVMVLAEGVGGVGERAERRTHPWG